MSRICGIFVILITAYTAAGCFSPIGSLGGSDAADLLLAAPNRVEYTAGDTFKPDSDLEVYAMYEGVQEPVPLDQVKISLAEPPYRPNDLKYVPIDEGYVLEKVGSNVVIVEYIGVSTSYSIEVLDSTGKGSQGSPGIHIEWAE